jgi:hypothetical protein
VAARAAAPAERRVAALLATEGLHAIEGDLRNVDTLHAAGFRMLGLTHFFDNEVAGSAHGVAKGGLTPLGRAVVRRMEALGILVDVAHASPRAVDDVLAMATRPVLVSHGGVQAPAPARATSPKTSCAASPPPAAWSGSATGTAPCARSAQRRRPAPSRTRCASPAWSTWPSAPTSTAPPRRPSTPPGWPR